MLTGVSARSACRYGISNAIGVLYDRLRELTEAGLVGRQDQDYAPTTLGRDLSQAIAPLDDWAKRWAKDVRAT
ncbi:MAG TPA: winged helix-turn-helix transcriptional regulator [Acidimicrobiales bacterium]|nr:winged helix-turn-helix transcriptional regulator [Acidimicrobiales bacterium]